MMEAEFTTNQKIIIKTFPYMKFVCWISGLIERIPKIISNRKNRQFLNEKIWIVQRKIFLVFLDWSEIYH